MGTNTTPDQSLLYVEEIHLNEHAKEGNVEALEGLPPHIINMNVHGSSLLHTSVLYAQDKFTEKLLQMGANVNPKDSDGRTPLDYSLEGLSGEDWAFLRNIHLLLEYGGTRGAGRHRLLDDRPLLLLHMKNNRAELYEEQKLEDAQKRLLLAKISIREIQNPSNVVLSVIPSARRRRLGDLALERRWEEAKDLEERFGPAPGMNTVPKPLSAKVKKVEVPIAVTIDFGIPSDVLETIAELFSAKEYDPARQRVKKLKEKKKN